MYPNGLLGESGSNGQTRRNVLLGLGGAAALGLAGCLGDGGDGASSDPEPTEDDGGSSSPADDDGGTSSPQPTTQPTGDGTAPVDLRVFPPDFHMDSFSSFSIAYESLVLTNTEGEEVTMPVGQTASLTDGSPATGVRVVEDMAVPAGEYESIDVHYSIDQAVTSDGQTAEIEFSSPESYNMVEIRDEPTTVEESSPYVIQTHFGLFSEPWSLSMPTIIFGPGIPD